ncbi:MAG: lysophospholipase [Saprospiraceae bacterium]|nr:lysophospholipase [Saprospiraceae bacterium]
MSEIKTGNRDLYIHQWIPEHPRVLLFILHGVFEHGGRYKDFAHFLNKDGIGVIAADHFGHGRSPGLKGYIDSWSALVDDTDHWIKNYRNKYPGIPCFLLGHSLGGLLAVSYLTSINPQFDGVVLMSAALKVSDDISPLLQKLAPVLATLAPKLKTVKLDANAISRDPDVVEKYLNDPYVYTGKIYAQTGNETLKTTRDIVRYFSEFKWPVLILHGTHDRLTDPAGSKKFYDDIDSRDKTLQLYEGAFHELLNEPEKDQVMEGIRIWITSRI